MADDQSGPDLSDDSSGSDESSDSSSSYSSNGGDGGDGGDGGVLAGFMNQCVTVRFNSGRTATGFFQGINDGLLRLFVAGNLVLVSLATVETISLAEPNAC